MTRRSADNSVRFSLFPFLAVLLCTMGALIIILVVLAQQGRAHAEQKARAKSAEPPDGSLDVERENAAWQIEQLEASRAKTAEDLRRDQLVLSHLEDHLRRLRDRMNGLAAAAADLEQTNRSTAQERERAAVELQRLKDRIAALEREVQDARARAAQPAFAILPYEGPNKTRRRPIYIECRQDAVILQPEGIVLESGDFDGPLGPRNPLASALRAACEHLANDPAVRSGGDPYPLLLVRPSGVAAYYKAREALESWGSDFGYELVEDDWKLAFPAPSAQLAKILARAVAEGRVYQHRLALAAPSRYRKPLYRATPHRGGVIRVDGNGGDSHSDFAERRVGGDGTSQGSGHGSPQTSESANEQTTTAGTSAQGAAGSGGQRAATGASAGQTPAARAFAKAAGAGGQGGTEASGAPGGQPGGLSVGMAPFSGPPPAHTRGANWALPDATRRAFPVSRSIRVLVTASRLVIVPDGRPQDSKAVPLERRTEDSLEAFISALWDHMKSWGIAGSGLYWRPDLVLQVEPNAAAAQRAADLRALLTDSGVEVRGPEGESP